MPMYRVRLHLGREQPQQSWPVRAAVTVLSLIALVGAAFLGAVVLIAFLGVAVVVGSIIAIRVWLLKRHIEKIMREADTTARDPRVIDAEYTDLE